MKHLVLLTLLTSPLSLQAPLEGREQVQATSLAAVASTPEPRTAINTTNTPGDADSVYRIDEPGSYYLEGNLHGRKARSTIEIAADDVSIDLMGFALLGKPGTLHGVTTDGPHLTATVRDLGSTNGTFVNGERVSNQRLEDGDRVTFGRTTVVYHAGRA